MCIRRVVYGAADAKAGCCGSVTDLFALPFNHHPMVEQGLRAEEAGALLQAFFKDLRVRLAARPKWKRPAPPAENMKNRKKVEAAWKSEQLPLSFFQQIVLYYSMVSCRNPSEYPGGRAAGPDLTGEMRQYALLCRAMGRGSFLQGANGTLQRTRQEGSTLVRRRV